VAKLIRVALEQFPQRGEIMEQTISGLSGETYRILPVMIGGISKSELPSVVRSLGSLSPCAEQAMRSTQFGTLAKQEERMYILLSARQLGWVRNPTLAELFDSGRLAEWSLARLAGHDIGLSAAEVGPHLAIQLRDQPAIDRVAIAMEPIVWSSMKYAAIFLIERISEMALMLIADWLDPEDDIPLDLPFVFSLKERSR
jgi:hypothetical protein